MYRLSGLVLATLLFASPSASANCGPFGMFGDNDYCVACPGRTPFKENGCPGGEVGLVAKGVTYQGCGISYYSPQTCKTGMAAAPMATKVSADENLANNPVRSGRAALTMKGDDVVVTMKKADFDKLMASGKAGATTAKK